MQLCSMCEKLIEILLESERHDLYGYVGHLLPQDTERRLRKILDEADNYRQFISQFEHPEEGKE